MYRRNFFTQLKRRNVYKVAVAYAVVAWLLMQAASIILPASQAPDWMMRVAHRDPGRRFAGRSCSSPGPSKITPEGLRRTDEVATPGRSHIALERSLIS